MSHTWRARRQAEDPRAGLSRRKVRRAALDELAAVGYGGFTMESVAARAGVGRSTVYRHWTDKLALIADALETLNEQPGPDDPAGTGRARVEQLLRHLTEVLDSSPFGRCVPALIHAAGQDPAVGGFLYGYSARRRQTLVDAIASGVETGELPATVDPELAATALSGTVFYRRLLTDDPVTPDDVPALVDAVLGVTG